MTLVSSWFKSIRTYSLTIILRFRLTQTVNKPTTFQENLAVAKAGGQVAGRTRKDIESQSNMPVISPKNAVQLNQVITDLLEKTTSDIPKKMDDK